MIYVVSFWLWTCWIYYMEYSIFHFWSCSLSVWGISRWELESWSANIIEPGQTAPPGLVLYWWQKLITFGSRRIRFKALNALPYPQESWPRVLTLKLIQMFFLLSRQLSSFCNVFRKELSWVCQDRHADMKNR